MKRTHFINFTGNKSNNLNLMVTFQRKVVWVLLVVFFFFGCSSVRLNEERKTPVTFHPQYTITGSGGETTGPLKITRIELNFSNDRGDMTIARNSELCAYAIIRFNGNGLFRASWEVDGIPLEAVEIHITFGNTITLRTGDSTIIPTFEPGPHNLTLRVKEPIPDFEIPIIKYFVTGEKVKE
jgi:hypothetical protein